MDFQSAALLVGLLVAGLTADHGESSTTKEFGYESENPDEIPPNSWSEEYGTCAGKYQSPIDIEEELVTRVSLPPLQFTNFDKAPDSALITNNGHTVMLKYNFSTPASVRGGPLLQGVYFFEQMHFHWGTNDSMGSEDLINNHSFACELHMVFFNSDYGNIENASKYKDGLVVLATFFEISPLENEVYETLIRALPDVTDPDKTEYLRDVPVLASLLPCNPERYFSYSGSLTTPPCLEVVTWIDFKHPVMLSHRQVHNFRSLHSHHGMLTHNFRPVQPLMNRPVWYNVNSLGSSASKFSSFNLLVYLFAVLSLSKCIGL